MAGTYSGDPDSYTIRDSQGQKAGDKGAKTMDAMNPVPRRTGDVPAKPTKAREKF